MPTVCGFGTVAQLAGRKDEPNDEETAAAMDILIVEDDEQFRTTVRQWMERHGHRVADAGRGSEVQAFISRQRFDVAVLDLNLPDISGLELLLMLQAAAPDTETIVLTGSASVETAVEAMKRGARDYLTKPFPLVALEERCRKAAEHGKLRKEAEQWKAVARRQQVTCEIVGNSESLRSVMSLIQRVGPTDLPVLIQGETGVGKELVAKAVQRCSRRADRPFVVVNCAALPEQLIESELFGHEKGAFTGATEAKSGLFEVADGGTLFIDEIGELPIALQPKLLRVLEDGSMRRVGSSRECRVDVRIIAATNRDLVAAVNEHRFREDLLYRVNVMTLQLPPLRERAGDVELLTQHFLPAGWTVAETARAALQRYGWPGNVRQLKNVIDRGTVLANGQTITVDDLPADIVNGPADLAATGAANTSVAAANRVASFTHQAGDTHQAVTHGIGDSSPAMSSLATSGVGPSGAATRGAGLVGGDGGSRAHQSLQVVERDHVLKVLAACHGNKSHAARELGIERRKLYRLLDRLGIETS